MDVQANIFDPIEITLDQRVFNGTNPRLSVIKFIERVYYHGLSHRLGVTGPEWASLYLTGSLTTYQYSETSDCDVTVFPDYDRIWKHLNLDPTEARKQLIEMNINYLDGTFVPGTHHPLQFFTQPPGLYPEDTFKPGLRSGYDLLDRQWMVPPERSRTHDVQKEMPQAFQRAAAIAEKMTIMLDAGDKDAARKLWHNVHAKRQLDQRAGLGDYSEGNIVYKWLLHEGLFDRIRNELHEYIAKIARPNDQAFLYDTVNDKLYMAGVDDWGRPQEHYAIMKQFFPNNEGRRRLWENGGLLMGTINPETGYYWNWNSGGEDEYKDRVYELYNNGDYVTASPPGLVKLNAFEMPLEVEQRFVNAMECPRCGGNLRKKETGTIYCENCGWRPRTSATDHLWDERVTTKVIYDFDKDRIVLGTQADLPQLHSDSKIVGEYDDGRVTLFEAGKQWINPSYFRRLWHVSYPDKHLKDVYYRRDSGDEYKLKSLPRKRKKGDVDPFMVTQKYQTGDHVVFDGGSGVIVGIPYVTNEGTFYYVNTYDQEGPRGIEVWPEDSLHRPESYDKPGESTLNDWFGIPPEGEQYYRNAALAKMIEEFKDQKWQHVKGEITVDDLKDPKIANGLCHTLALSFADFARQHGHEAWLPKYGTGTPEAFGYTDRKIKGPIGHYWAYVKIGNETYGVDWTAAQFGYDDIPVVQKLTESGWMR